MFAGLLGVGRRAYRVMGKVQLKDIEEHMVKHVENALERTEALVSQ